MQLRPVAYAEAAALVDALAAELHERYGGGPASVAHPEQFVPPYGVFLLGTEDGVAVACGGVRLLPSAGEGVGEVKRMYVVPSARARGLARVRRRALVDHARGAGLRSLWLETGTAQPEAISLYESEGFTPIPRYGQYKDSPESRCYALAL